MEEQPLSFSVAGRAGVESDLTDTIHIRYPISNTMITVQQDGLPVGRALISNGEATIKTIVP